MIETINGNMLDLNNYTNSEIQYILCHQVNCQGVMGSGIAKQIRNMCPKHYKDYRFYYTLTVNKNELLGKEFYTRFNENLWFCGIFGQYDYGREKKQYTNYDALKSGFVNILQGFRTSNKNIEICIPYGIGCGLGGGDWGIVKGIIDDIFGSSKINVKIWRL